jgi:hypothetical protein
MMTHAKARTEPDALLAELEQARAQFQAAERRSRTYLASHGMLDQTHVDVTAALRCIASGRRSPSKQRTKVLRRGGDD